MSAIQIFTDATTGNSGEFKSYDKKTTFRLAIDGTSGSNINAFVDFDPHTRNLFLKVSGITDAAAKLQAKFNNGNDDFSDSGQEFTSDFAGTLYYK